MVKGLRRSILFSPADDPSGIKEAAKTAADGIVYELEDMVAREDKEAARENLREEVPGLDFSEKECIVRINSLKTQFWLDDLQTAIDIDADAIVLPKVDFPREVQTVVDVLRQLAPEPPEVIIMLESPRAFFHGAAIAEKCAEFSIVTGGFYGEGDYCEHVGATHANDNIRKFLNQLMVGYAAIGNLDGIAAADLNIEDEAAQRRYSEHCRDLGFVGQQALYPHQVDQINSVFTPSEEEYQRARELVKVFEQSAEGNMVVDGIVLDRPLVNRYRQIIAKYNAVHDIDEDVTFDLIDYE